MSKQSFLLITVLVHIDYWMLTSRACHPIMVWRGGPWGFFPAGICCRLAAEFSYIILHTLSTIKNIEGQCSLFCWLLSSYTYSFLDGNFTCMPPFMVWRVALEGSFLLTLVLGLQQSFPIWCCMPYLQLKKQKVNPVFLLTTDLIVYIDYWMLTLCACLLFIWA